MKSKYVGYYLEYLFKMILFGNCGLAKKLTARSSYIYFIKRLCYNIFMKKNEGLFIMMLLGIVLYIILGFIIIRDGELSSFNVLFEKLRNAECSKILNNFY